MKPQMSTFLGGGIADGQRLEGLVGEWIRFPDGLDRWDVYRRTSEGDYRLTRRRRWILRLEFKFEDFWVGAFWRREKGILHVWICLLPCLPLHLELWP